MLTYSYLNKSKKKIKKKKNNEKRKSVHEGKRKGEWEREDKKTDDGMGSHCSLSHIHPRYSLPETPSQLYLHVLS